MYFYKLLSINDLKSSKSEINLQLASLSNELQQKENIIKNNNLSITEIKKPINLPSINIGTERIIKSVNKNEKIGI